MPSRSAPSGHGVIRPAHPGDVPSLCALVRELAEFEREADKVRMTEGQLSDALFGSAPAVFAHVAVIEDRVVAMAIWFVTFSTWTGRHGIFLEDLYVQLEHRGRGIGLGLLGTLAKIAVERGYARIDWRVLDWNERARSFYRSLGAVELDDWRTCRLEGSAIAEVANR